MKEKKHIDRIFQEKLKNFEATPNDAIWERIHAELHKDKRKRKIIPIWWKIAGVAAGLLLMFTIGNAVFNASNTIEVNNIPYEVVDVENNTTNKTKEDAQTVSEEKDSINEQLNNNLFSNKADQVTSSDNKNETRNESVNNVIKNATNSAQKNYTRLKEAVVSTSDQTPKNNKPNNVLPSRQRTYKATGVATSSVAEQNNAYAGNKNVSENTVPKAVSGNTNQHLIEEQSELKKTVTEMASVMPEKTSTTNGIAVKDTPQKEEKEIDNTTENAGPTIEEALAFSEDEEDISEKEKKVINRWSVTPNVSPVYYNTLGKGSSIHSQFNNNSKSGQLNMSFGVNASYALSEKLSVRSGVNKVNVGYSTNDVVVYQSINTIGKNFRQGFSLWIHFFLLIHHMNSFFEK